MTVNIIKCGGSLLDVPDLPTRLLSLLDAETSPASLLIIGGGPAADFVRHWDERHGLSDSDAHDLAINAMTLSARLVASLHDRFILVETVEDIAALPAGAVAVLSAAVAIKRLEAEHARLPRSWDITSDSIAAWLANIWRAKQLTLLKSVDLPFFDKPVSLDELARRGLVDRCFPEFARSVPNLRWCNLRNDQQAMFPIDPAER